jgi:cytochrome c oxidase cbb3-type subunit 3
VIRPTPALRPLGLASLVAVCATLIIGASGSCSGSGPTPGDDPAIAAGARDYRTYCGLCHGDRGEGYAADNAGALANDAFLASASDAFLQSAIERGRPGTAMAAYSMRFGGPLSAEKISGIIAFLRSRQRTPNLDFGSYAAVDHGVDARPLYETHCASCHGERGQGATAPSLNNPTFVETVTDGFLRHAIAKGRRRTPMPGFEDRLSADQIDALVVYIHSFARHEAPRQEHPQSAIPADMPLVIHPDGPQAEFTLREGRFVPSAQVARALAAGKRLIILDARAPSDWALARIPGAIPTPYYAIEELAGRLPDDGTWIIAYCGCPHAASGHVVDALRERGFRNTAVLDEGILVWRELGFPVEGDSVEE